MHRNIKVLIILCISLQMVDVRESEDSSRDFEGHFLRGQPQTGSVVCVCPLQVTAEVKAFYFNPSSSAVKAPGSDRCSKEAQRRLHKRSFCTTAQLSACVT